jgi:uncharacterized protein (TIRG00374 family)
MLNDRAKSVVTTVLKMAFAAGVITYLVMKGFLDLNVFSLILSPGYLSACLFVGIFNIGLATTRWYLLVTSQGVEVSFWRVTKMNLIGLFFNYAMPGGVGGDVVKGFYLVKEVPEKRLTVAMSVVMDRFIGLFSMVALAAAVVLVNYEMALSRPDIKYLFAMVALVFVAYIIVAAVLFSSRLKRVFEGLINALPGSEIFFKVYDAAQMYLKSPKVMIYSLVLSVFAHLSVMVFFLVIAHAMGITSIPLGAYFFAVPLGLIAQALPVSPAGIGVGQAAMLYFFNVYTGGETNLGANALTVFQVTLFVISLVGAYFFLTMKKQGLSEVTSGQ